MSPTMKPWVDWATKRICITDRHETVHLTPEEALELLDFLKYFEGDIRELVLIPNPPPRQVRLTLERDTVEYWRRRLQP